MADMGRSSEGMREVSIRDIPCVMRKFRFEDVKRFLTPPPSKLDCAWAWASMLRIANKKYKNKYWIYLQGGEQNLKQPFIFMDTVTFYFSKIKV